MIDLDAIEQRLAEASVQVDSISNEGTVFRVGEWIFAMLKSDLPALLRIARAAEAHLPELEFLVAWMAETETLTDYRNLHAEEATRLGATATALRAAVEGRRPPP